MRPSKTRTRLRVILWTGWPHKTLARVQPEHLQLARQTAYVTPRRKGKGTKGRWLPLLPSAVAALKQFHQDDCYGPFSHSSMHKAFRLALAKLNAHRKALNLPALKVRPYDFRHSFGTMVAERQTDDRALQELMLHSRAEQSRRYTERATAKRVMDAIAAVAGTSTASAHSGVARGQKAPQVGREQTAKQEKKPRKGGAPA